MCNFGCYETESQYHLLNCDMIIRHCPQLYNDQTIEYEDMYGSTEKQVLFTKLFKCVLQVRSKLLQKTNIS